MRRAKSCPEIRPRFLIAGLSAPSASSGGRSTRRPRPDRLLPSGHRWRPSRRSSATIAVPSWRSRLFIAGWQALSAALTGGRRDPDRPRPALAGGMCRADSGALCHHRRRSSRIGALRNACSRRRTPWRPRPCACDGDDEPAGSHGHLPDRRELDRKPRDVVYIALRSSSGRPWPLRWAPRDRHLGRNYLSRGTRAAPGGRRPNYQAAAFLRRCSWPVGCSASSDERRASRLGRARVHHLRLLRDGVAWLSPRATFSVLAAFVLFRREAEQIFVLMLAGATAVAVYLDSRPDALIRLTTFGGGGSGRDDLWGIAWRIFETSVGRGRPGNFRVLEARFVLRPGSLTHVTLISEKPEIVHNAYLELLVDRHRRSRLLRVRRSGQHAGQLGRCQALPCDRANGWPTSPRGSHRYHRSCSLRCSSSRTRTTTLWVLFAAGPVLTALARPAFAPGSPAGGLLLVGLSDAP